MKTARFHVFSGTGNSLHLAESLAYRLGSAGWGTELVPVRRDREPLKSARPAAAPGTEDLDIFVFPVYALSVPHLMKAYIRSLGRVGGEGSRPRAAVLATNGRISSRFRDGHEGQALAQAERILARRGWEVVYRETFDYPQSITSLINAQKDETRTKIVGLMAERTERVAADLAAGRAWKRRAGPIVHILGWPFGMALDLVGRRAWAMTFAADSRCNGCGLCARECPAQAIRMVKGRPDWSYACEACEGCINRCPQKAIQASVLRLALIVALTAAVEGLPLGAPVRGLLGFLPPFLGETVWLVLATALGLLVLRVLDLALFGLAFVPGLRDVLSFGWTRWYRRYSPPPRGGPEE